MNTDSNKLRPVWHDSMLTLITSAMVILLNILLTGVLSRGMIKFDFENYLFVRRFIAFLFPITTLSVGTGLTWIMAKERSNPESQMLVCKGTLYLLLLFNLLILGAALLMPEYAVKNYFFPVSPEYLGLWKTTFVWLTAYTGYIMLYSYYRGKMNMDMANAINLFANGISPLLIVLYLITHNNLGVSNFLLIWAGIYGCSFLFLAIHAGNILKGIKDSVIYAYKEVITYSAPRIPAGILATAIPFLIPYLMKKNGNGDETVFFLSAFIVIQAVYYFTDPLGQVFLPRSAFWHGKNDLSEISNLFDTIFSSSIQIGLILTVQIYIWADLIAIRWFGGEYEQTARAIQFLSLSIIPALLFTPMRSILDGIDKKAFITLFLAISAGLSGLLCITLYFNSALNIFSACMAVLFNQALTTLLILKSLKKRLKFNMHFSHFCESLGLAVMLGICSFILHKLPWRDSIYISIVAISSAALISAVATILWASIRKPCWWKDLVKLIFKIG